MYRFSICAKNLASDSFFNASSTNTHRKAEATNAIIPTTYNKTLHGNIRNLIVTPLTRGIVTLGEGYFNKTDSGYIVSECANKDL